MTTAPPQAVAAHRVLPALPVGRDRTTAGGALCGRAGRVRDAARRGGHRPRRRTRRRITPRRRAGPPTGWVRSSATFCGSGSTSWRRGSCRPRWRSTRRSCSQSGMRPRRRRSSSTAFSGASRAKGNGARWRRVTEEADEHLRGPRSCWSACGRRGRSSSGSRPRRTPTAPIDVLTELAELAKEVELSSRGQREPRPRVPRALTSCARSSRATWRSLRSRRSSMGRRRCATARSRAASGSGPSSALAVGEAAGAAPERCLPAAAALELVHTFSLVHDDLPALDDDDERRGRPSAHVGFGEAVALLAGDALLAEAFRLALSYPTPAVARELAAGDARHDRRPVPRRHGRRRRPRALHRLKTGRALLCGGGGALWAADVPERRAAPWRAFGDELGLLFQIVDDSSTETATSPRHGVERARELADDAAERRATGSGDPCRHVRARRDRRGPRRPHRLDAL